MPKNALMFHGILFQQKLYWQILAHTIPVLFVK